MDERDTRKAGERETAGHNDAAHLAKGATPGQVGALDGAAAAGSGVAKEEDPDLDASIPSPPDPRFGPD